MGQFVAAKVLSEDEVISELSRAAKNTGLDSDEIRKTIISGLESGNKHPRLIPEKAQPNSTGTKVAPSEILERINADPRAIKEPATLAALAALKANDPIEYDLLLESIKKAGTGVKVATINDLVDKAHPRGREGRGEAPGDPGGHQGKGAGHRRARGSL
jgi:hypothetical protein